MTKADCLVSVVAPLHNDAPIIEEFVAAVHAVLSTHYTYYEIVLVDDHSRDATTETVRELLQRFRCVRMIRLSKAMGFEAAIAAGLDSAIGDFVVTMVPNDDPPDAIPTMVDISRRGADIVTGVPTNRPEPGDALPMGRVGVSFAGAVASSGIASDGPEHVLSRLQPPGGQRDHAHQTQAPVSRRSGGGDRLSRNVFSLSIDLPFRTGAGG
ncbi:MAG: glycosyltransferase [Deltaproteobacteria bacterium]|nr:glycosyltransferase [Deltaproteobacteria bacterium]